MAHSTPGPWFADGNEIRWQPTPNTLAVVVARFSGNNDEAFKNTRIGAAAPELLDALYQYRSDLRHPPAPDSVERRLQMIEKLIAKATGEA